MIFGFFVFATKINEIFQIFSGILSVHENCQSENHEAERFREEEEERTRERDKETQREREREREKSRAPVGVLE
jgi:hypothetical protein